MIEIGLKIIFFPGLPNKLIEFIVEGLKIIFFLGLPNKLIEFIEEALKIIQLAKEKDVPIFGGSSLKYSNEVNELKDIVVRNIDSVKGGFVSAPVDFESQYSGFWFYASHLTEMLMETFGWDPQSVYAYEKNGTVQAIVDYTNYSVNCSFINHNYSSYTCIVFEKDSTERRKVLLDTVSRIECDNFVEMLRTRKMNYRYDQLIKPVYFIDAVIRSYKSGKKVNIEFGQV